jgi:(3R)-3-hydroxyacyl-CoA dehydrogenase / 3a,7a,12a-trihydroxy-5b-cholest-24-enoyl-CoA hydratase / enoyl-CoA hydratase 2
MAPIKSKDLMLKIKAGVAEKGAQMVKDVKGVIQYIIKGGEEGEWVIDLKNGKGEVYPGKVKSGKADITITIQDQDMLDMASGKLNPQQAFMKGKLKIKGNMGLAMKLGKVMEAAK